MQRITSAFTLFCHMHSKVEKHRKKKVPSSRSSRIGRIIGPGLVTGASDDDPSGIATYSQAGAAFGLATLWTAVLTLPLMVAIQEMCARIGLVTGSGLTGIIKRNYPAPLMWLIVAVSFPAIVLNIGADLAGMGAVANMLLPGLPASVYSSLIGVGITYLTVALPYRKISRILRWLCLALLCYLIVPFLTTTDWGQALKNTLWPRFSWDRDYIAIIVALLGTTISPYLFFWQTSMEVEEVSMNRIIVGKRALHDMQVDVRTGMFFSNLVSFFIILTAGTVLFNAGVHDIKTVEEAAKALEPLAGKFTYLLFAIGVLGTGLLAVPVLAGALSYMVSEALGWKEGLDKKFNEARGFYMVMVFSILSALLINITGISPMHALILTAVIYGLTAPLLIGMILHICNNRLIMGEHVNGRWSNIFGVLALLLMTVAALALIFLELN
jgi:NRAMP (natural resistance-associated macrophage protein)-like metal ion transporter